MSAQTVQPFEDLSWGRLPTVGESSHENPTPAVLPTRKARVLHVINGEHYSGAERVQDLLAQHLPQFGYDVSFACLKPDRFPSQRQCQDSTLYKLPMATRLDLRVVFKLCRIVQEGEFRLIHAHTPRSALIARLVAGLAGVPMVYHVHSPTSRDSTRPWLNRVNEVIERTSLWRVAGMITVSQSLGHHMRRQGYDAERIFVVPNGVPATDSCRTPELPHGSWQLGSVALFRPRKGLEVLLDALAILKQRGVAVRLRAVGPFETPEYEARIHQQVQHLSLTDDIDWVGFTSDVTSELARMDLFVLPSLFGEGLPMVVLEAMAAGVPVIGTRVEGVPEAIDDGVNGIVAQPGDPTDLANGIQSIVSGRINWSIMRQRALETHAKQFSATQMARGVAAVYDRVLRAQRVSS